MFGDVSSSHKIDWVKKFLEILNLGGQQNFIIGFKIIAILLNGWLLPIAGASSERVFIFSLHLHSFSTGSKESRFSS